MKKFREVTSAIAAIVGLIICFLEPVTWVYWIVLIVALGWLIINQDILNDDNEKNRA